MTVPPAFSTLSAITEVFVSAAVFWFFYKALRWGDYRWGVITVAIVYETLFNITYMVRQAFEHQEGVSHSHPPWVTGFVIFHGSLSLLMFLGLIAYVLFAWLLTRRGREDPVGSSPLLAYGFLVLWTISVVTGEVIYFLYWSNVVQPA